MIKNREENIYSMSKIVIVIFWQLYRVKVELQFVVGFSTIFQELFLSETKKKPFSVGSFPLSIGKLVITKKRKT